MVIGLHEIVDGEVIFAVIEASAASDDLLELDHGIDGTHQNDIADVGRVHAGRELSSACTVQLLDYCSFRPEQQK